MNHFLPFAGCRLRLFAVALFWAGFATPATAQIPAIAWQRFPGGITLPVLPTTDGGYVVTGSGINITKYSATGSVLWSSAIGGSGNNNATGILQTTDGGYLLTATTTSTDGDVTGNHGGQDIWIAKLNATGSVVWQKCLGGSADDGAFALRQTADMNYIIAGYANSTDGDVSGHSGGTANRDTWVIKINGSGDVIWSDCFGGTGTESTGGLEITPDGGAVIAGGTTSADGDVTGNHGAKDLWVLKLNSLGGLQWQQCYGGTADDAATYIQATTDGNFILTGFTHSENGDVTGNHGGGDEWVVKLGPTGNLLWQHCLGGSDNDFAQCIQQTGDGGYILSGYTFSTDYDVTGNHGLSDCWIVKLNPMGNIVWQRAYGGSGGEIGSFIRLTTDGGYIFTGYTNSTDGDVVGNDDGSGSWVVKLAGTTGVEMVASENTMRIYPNPVHGQALVAVAVPTAGPVYLCLTNSAGQQVLESTSRPGGAALIDVSGLSSGLYFMTATPADGPAQHARLMVE